MLECRNESELDPFALLVACVRAGRALECEAPVGVGLEPDGLGHRIGESVVRVSRGSVVDRQHPLGSSLDRAQARVGRDPVQPGAKRTSQFESRQSAPGAQQRLLQRIFCFGVGAEHAVAVGVKLVAVRLDEQTERVVVAVYRRGQHFPFAVISRDAGGRRWVGFGRHRFGCHNAISPAWGMETTLRHPAGPSRGSRSTRAPSCRARSVCSPIWSTST